MIKATKKQKIDLKLVLSLIVIAIGIIISYKNAFIARNDYYDMQCKAANRLSECMEKVKGYKLEVGAKLSDYEYFDTGMLGEEYNFITTSLGDLSAKRTTANPDMAALIITMYQKLGLKEGDMVGIGLSGSFPTMNMAVIIAAEEMGLKPIVISSVGASTYGANNPEISFPEILHRLNTNGYISNDSIFITMGGDGDIGLNLDQELINAIKLRIISTGIPIYSQSTFNMNVSKRIESYGDIDCFVSVGGNITSTGEVETALTLGQGILKPKSSYNYVDGKSGVIEYYLANDVPVINILNIKKIMADYSMPFDPIKQTHIGESTIYYKIVYPKAPLAVALIIVSIILISGNDKLRLKKKCQPTD